MRKLWQHKGLFIGALLSLLSVGFVVAQSVDAAKDDAKPKRVSTCFYTDDVKDFETVDNDTLRVTTYRRESFDLEVPGCMGLDHAVQVAIVSRFNDRICSAFDGEVMFEDQLGGRCPIVSVKAVQKPAKEEAKP